MVGRWWIEFEVNKLYNFPDSTIALLQHTALHSDKQIVNVNLTSSTFPVFCLASSYDEDNLRHYCVKMSPEHGKKFMENKIARKAR